MNLKFKLAKILLEIISNSPPSISINKASNEEVTVCSTSSDKSKTFYQKSKGTTVLIYRVFAAHHTSSLLTKK